MARGVEYTEPETNGTLPYNNDQIEWLLGRDILTQENTELRKTLDKMEKTVTELAKRIPKEKALVLRDIPIEQAKNEIKQLFESGRTLYYSDIADELSLDLELVVNICNELLESGDIHIDDSIA